MTGPFALFVPEDTVYGTVYYPANRIASDLAALAGVRAIPEDRLPYIRSLGFEVAYQNGDRIPVKAAKAPYQNRC
jgi:hypothetical protein